MKTTFLTTATDLFRTRAIPPLTEYIRIENCTPGSEFHRPVHTQAAVRLMHEWAQSESLPGMTVEVKQLSDASSPLIYINIPATPGYENLPTIALYCHGDKQPPLHGEWSDGLGPYTPVIRGDKLYGRGSADDGYGIFASILALKTLLEHDAPHARIVIITEFSEESGSPDLPLYMKALEPNLGPLGLLFCLDSGAKDFNRLWITTSLRGLLDATIRIDVLEHEMHSGSVGGIVPSPYDIGAQLLDRIRDRQTGKVLLPALQPVSIPEERRLQNAEIVSVLGERRALEGIHFAKGARALKGAEAALLDSRWRASVAVIGLNGLPSIEKASNTMFPFLELRLSVRIPPTTNSEMAMEALRGVIERTDCPARITFTPNMNASGWHAPALADWLKMSLDSASTECFGKPMMFMGEGGTIPFMRMLQAAHPDTQVVVTGVLSDDSNAHGPDESLDIPAACKVTAVVASVISDQIALA